ncbi:MAG: dTDP-4-dehydrorhamnose 3,5-epimerase [Porphyromonadaceae bacterium]|nr:dTDP-4-dehydrorhamnose 3,5-epimerase [Porphyromonadaceae bacterium]
MTFEKLSIDGLLLMKPRIFRDNRGYFFESFRQKDFEDAVGQKVNFVQENESRSSFGVLRGLHLQKGDDSQAKLVRCVRGRIIDIAVDLRKGSSTFGQYEAVELSEDNHFEFFVPRHFAHGYIVLSEEAVFQYKVDNLYAPQSECCISYDDPDIDIAWSELAPHVETFNMSSKDQNGISLKEYIDQN